MCHHHLNRLLSVIPDKTFSERFVIVVLDDLVGDTVEDGINWRIRWNSMCHHHLNRLLSVIPDKTLSEYSQSSVVIWFLTIALIRG